MRYQRQTRKDDGAWKTKLDTQSGSLISVPCPDDPNSVIGETCSVDPKTGDMVYHRIKLSRREINWFAQRLEAKTG